MKFLSFSFSFNFDPMIYIHMYVCLWGFSGVKNDKNCSGPS